MRYANICTTTSSIYGLMRHSYWHVIVENDKLTYSAAGPEYGTVEALGFKLRLAPDLPVGPKNEFGIARRNGAAVPTHAEKEGLS
jgi:hypothetical protein